MPGDSVNVTLPTVTVWAGAWAGEVGNTYDANVTVLTVAEDTPDAPTLYAYSRVPDVDTSLSPDTVVADPQVIGSGGPASARPASARGKNATETGSDVAAATAVRHARMDRTLWIWAGRTGQRFGRPHRHASVDLPLGKDIRVAATRLKRNPHLRSITRSRVFA
jgi:hypothetical protein